MWTVDVLLGQILACAAPKELRHDGAVMQSLPILDEDGRGDAVSDILQD